MRLLHTSDWHLGHTLHDLPRDYEHQRFLSWLVDTLEDQRIDALLIAGDIFDAANPPARAQSAWFEFLAAAKRRLPDLDIVAIGGNHDSPTRLDAPHPVLEAFGVHVVGGLERRGDRCDVNRLLAPVRNRDGDVAAWVAAVPFLRPSDLPPPQQPADDALIEGVRATYARVIDEARARRAPGQALVAMGHCYMIGTTLSKTSERRILGGNQHALPVDIFPRDIAYAALGHLHKAQKVRRPTVRYCGAPIPLSIGEARYKHQVVVVELDGEQAADIAPVPVPRALDVLRVPRKGPAPLADVLAELDRLPLHDLITPFSERPFLEVRVSLPRPEPSMRRDIDEVLKDKAPRLVKLTVEYTGDESALAESVPGKKLRDLDPEEVFSRRYRRDHEGDPPAELVGAFRDLLDQVSGEEVERVGGDREGAA